MNQMLNPPKGQNPLGRRRKPRPSAARNVGQSDMDAEGNLTRKPPEVLLPTGKCTLNFERTNPKTDFAGETTGIEKC